MNSKDIQAAVNRLFTNNRYVLFNSYIFDWESDYFSITIPKQYSVEVEIKISTADFKKDFTHKQEKHRLLSGTNKKLHTRQYPHVFRYSLNSKTGEVDTGEYCMVDFINPKHFTPNRFYYAAPEGLISLDKIPDYAGLIEVQDRSEQTAKPFAWISKQAPFLHKENVFERKHSVLLDKFWWEVNNIRSDYEYQKYLVKELRKNAGIKEK